MRTNHTTDRRRGSALVMAMVMVTTLGMLSLSILSTVGSSYKLNRQVRTEAGARYVAEAGIAEAIYALSQGGNGSLGNAKQRLDYGGGTYWVETEDLGSNRISLVSTGLEDTAASRVQVVLDLSAGSIFSWGAFGDEGLSMSSNSMVDSYDSSAGTYKDQAVNGSGADTYANQEGNVGSNSNVSLDSNAIVNGNAVPGSSGTTTVAGNADVTGSTSPAAVTNEMSTIDLPPTPSAGPWEVDGSASLPAGDHAFDDFLLKANGTLTVTGPATVVFQNAVIDSNAQIIVDARGGPVQFYVLHDFLMSSNTTFGAMSRIPADVELNLLTDNVINPDVPVDLDTVGFDSNAKFYGTLYAPNAHVAINSNFELFGALIARSVALDSNARIHFDEALMDARDASAAAFTFTKVFWTELSVPYSEIKY